ncbi:sugar kinase [Amycolatopsis lurida]
MSEPDRALDAVTFGEVMAMFVAAQAGPLEQYRRALAGAEYNVAVGLARLGHRTGWIGRVGDDPFGHYALAELARHGIDALLVTVDAAAPTAFQIKSSAPGGEPRVVYFRAHSAGSRLAPSAAADDYVAGARHLHATGIPLALWPDRRAMVRAVNDLALRADWVLPGVGEGEVLTGRREPEAIAAWYLERGVRLVAVKRGALGAELYTVDGERWHWPSFAVEAVDSVGAGDGFAGGLISTSLDGEPREAWLARASAVGALATTGTGDQDGLPDRAALSAFVDEGVPR